MGLNIDLFVATWFPMRPAGFLAGHETSAMAATPQKLSKRKTPPAKTGGATR
jgi:hypothetical protein